MALNRYLTFLYFLFYWRFLQRALERYSVENEMDKSELFQMFEIMGRSLSDFVNAERKALQLDSWPKWLANLVVAAASIEKANRASYTTGQSPGRIDAGNKWLSKDVKARFLRDYMREGNFMLDVFSHGNNNGYVGSNKQFRHMTRAAVAFVMIKTFKIDRNASRIFWINVKDGENLSKNDPRKLLREFLMLNQTRDTKRALGSLANHEIVYRCSLAWNHFRKGTQVKALLYRSDCEPQKLI